MRKLFLASETENVLEKLASLMDHEPENTKVAFIPTAADTYQDKSFVREDRSRWKELNYTLKEIKLGNKDQSELRKDFRDCDIIYLAGGNVFYLLQEARKCKLGELIEELTKKGKIFAGASAGAAIAGPNIEPLRPVDDPSEAPDLKNYSAFGLVDFVILPHSDTLKYSKEYKKVVEKHKKFNFRKLTNNQALFVSGDEIKLIESDKG